MSRVCDFNLIKGLDTRANATNSNNVNVVVNNPPTLSASSSTANIDTNVTYSSATASPTPLLPQEATVDVPQQTKSENDDCEFYKTLSTILSNVLKDNNPKLIINVIDTSGKIIIKASELIQLIAVKTHKNVRDVNIRYYEQEPNCMQKISPIKIVEDIQINNESFSLRYNSDYNILKDTFNISLAKVIIG